jgi:hypothetical protein
MAFLYVILFAVLFKTTEETPIKPGASGRYCGWGRYNVVTGGLSDYEYDHYCGVHLIDYRACVTVAYANNYTEMGCDNDGGIFPTCDHDQDYCYYSGDTRICCCNSDHCNDCSLHPGHCFNPRSEITTTRPPATTTTLPTTTTTKPLPETTTKPPSTTCALGGVKWQKDCYFFNGTLSAFIIAEEMCNNLGGHLSSIHDGFTNNFIAQNAAYYFHESTTVDLWIGGSDMISLGNWSWTDGSPFIFTEWNHGKNATGEDCLAQSFNDGRWNSVDCFKAKPYACTVPL